MKNQKKKQIVSFYLFIILFLGVLSPFISAESYNSVTTSVQETQPSFSAFSRKNNLNDSCFSNQDFLIYIPPLGCTPKIVRSDLLADQDVPVYCRLEAIKLNPLIEVTNIRSISFDGDYPPEVKGISFHPARAAIDKQSSINKDPLIEEVGYVAILLNQQPKEENLTEWVGGFLNAKIKYDLAGRNDLTSSEYFLREISDSDWDQYFNLYSFWSGNAYLRLDKVDKKEATIQVLTGKNDIYRTLNLNVGEESSTVYLPGSFCKAGFKISLERMVGLGDNVILNVDGSRIWVQEGSKLLDGKCVINSIKVSEEKNGVDVNIKCASDFINLKLKPREEDYLRDSSIIGSDLKKVSEEYFENVKYLIEEFGYEKDEEEIYFGEGDLVNAIERAHDLKQYKTEEELIDLFLQTYPLSNSFDVVTFRNSELKKYDYSNATESFYLNNKYHKISVEDFLDYDDKLKKANIRINDDSYKIVEEGSIVKTLKESTLAVEKIEIDGVTFVYTKGDEIKKEKIELEDIKKIEEYTIFVENVEIDSAAYVKVEPIYNDKFVESNFSFNISIEKRMELLTPEVANKTASMIGDWINWLEDVNKVTEDVLGAWRVGCLGVSAVLMAKNLLSGEAVARQAVVGYFKKSVCNDENSETCIFKNSEDIEKAINEYDSATEEVDIILKEIQKESRNNDGVLNNKDYLDNLKEKLDSSNNGLIVLDEKEISVEKLITTNQVRDFLLYEELCSNPNSYACKASRETVKESLGSIYLDAITKTASNLFVSFFSFIPLVSASESNSEEEIEKIPCSNKIKEEDWVVRYYDENLAGDLVSGSIGEGISPNNLPAVVPFDVNNGWYAFISSTMAENLLSSESRGYYASGQLNNFYICNVGENQRVENKGGDDICILFNANYDNIKSWGGCGLNEPMTNELKAKAISAIYDAAEQYGKDNIKIAGTSLGVGLSIIDALGLECTDLMSAADCALMYNVCDPVICPTSRCDFNNKYAVENVIQSGFVGSLTLCAHNFGNPEDGKVLIPFCLSGLHASSKNLEKVLTEYKSCLEVRGGSGEYVGVCDEVLSVYFCETVWETLADLTEVYTKELVQDLFFGGNGEGGEYLAFASTWDAATKSYDLVINEYLGGLDSAFNLGDWETIATSDFCQQYIGISAPTNFGDFFVDAVDSMSSLEVPYQFNARFSESLFNEYTVPPTSHYQTYFYIYAGEDSNVNYHVYLSNPPEGKGYSEIISINRGTIEKGGVASESLDFTSPQGYGEICVNINGKEYCGFDKVGTDFSIEYTRQNYIENEIAKNKITTEAGCVSTSILSSIENLEEGLYEGALWNLDGDLTQTDSVEKLGITRTCATQNPGTGTSGTKVSCLKKNDCSKENSCDDESYCVDSSGNYEIGYTRWVEVGYCGDPEIKCWLDSEEFDANLKLVSEELEETLGKIRLTDQFEEISVIYSNVKETLNGLRNDIISLKEEELDDWDIEESLVFNISIKLNEIAGYDVDHSGYGNNNQKARALYLKNILYRKLIDYYNVPGKVFEGGPIDTKIFVDEINQEKRSSRDRNLEEQKDIQIQECFVQSDCLNLGHNFYCVKNNCVESKVYDIDTCEVFCNEGIVYSENKILFCGKETDYSLAVKGSRILLINNTKVIGSYYNPFFQIYTSFYDGKLYEDYPLNCLEKVKINISNFLSEN